MRGILYRRHILNRTVIKRLKRHCNNRYSYYNFRDANDIRLGDPNWYDYIGTYLEFKYKTMTTHKSDSHYKNKYGKNCNNNYYTYESFTRLSDKRLFKKMLENEYGIKHVYT